MKHVLLEPGADEPARRSQPLVPAAGEAHAMQQELARLRAENRGLREELLPTRAQRLWEACCNGAAGTLLGVIVALALSQSGR